MKQINTGSVAGGNKVSALSSAISKTNTSVGAAPMPGSRRPKGQMAGRVAPSRELTASEHSGSCGKLAMGPCRPKA